MYDILACTSHTHTHVHTHTLVHANTRVRVCVCVKYVCVCECILTVCECMHTYIGTCAERPLGKEGRRGSADKSEGRVWAAFASIKSVAPVIAAVASR